MGAVINMHEAKTELSKLVERALAGEDIVIARAGIPVVRLVPVARQGERVLGRWRGKVRISAGFDALLPEEILADWER